MRAFLYAVERVVAATLLVILLPALVLMAVLVWLDSRGCPLYMQTRLGLNARPFVMLKLRTMLPCSDREPAESSPLSDPSDPRLTRVGRFLRACSVDELPQLWNIAMGHMRFVGPRPILPEQYRAVPERCLTRFRVRPGVTGLAQVYGRRAMSWPQQLDLDRQYAEEACAATDLAILIRTIRVVLIREGVYGNPEDNWRSFLDGHSGTVPTDEERAP